ncbi:MAG: hypothetical protein K6G70_08785 [Bacteroidaceae bacterium]|nr:hypothetical protein [Bacteroidaceae bacterium]
MTKEEFESIYRQHYAKMYRLARTMLYDADESKDVVSDIFARLLRERLRVGASAGMKYHPQRDHFLKSAIFCISVSCGFFYLHNAPHLHH